MALTKEEVREAFREAVAKDYADVPPTDEIEHEFSPEFYAKMNALIEEQRRGSWRLLNRQTRRALVVAAILTISLLLTACSPKLREAFVELMITVYETFVEYKADADNVPLHAEIVVPYALVPEQGSFELVSQERLTPRLLKSVYIDQDGHQITVTQSCVALIGGASDAEYSETLRTVINETEVLVAQANDVSSAQMYFEGYSFRISHQGPIELEEFKIIISSLAPNG